MVHIAERKVYERVVRGKYRYRDVYTLLPVGSYKEYNYGDISVYTKGDDESFNAFMEKPYIVIQQNAQSLLITPKWTGIRAGWLVNQNESFYVYRVDRFALWAGLIPDELKDEFDLEARFKTLRLEEGYLVGSEEELREAWRRYRPDLLRRERGKGIRVKSGRIVSLSLKLLKDGVIPWTSKHVKASWKWKTDIQLRPYQREALEFWLRNGCMTLLFPFGGGKTFTAIAVISAVSDKTLIVVPSLTLVGQWVRALKKHLSGPRIGEYSGERKTEGDVIVATYQTALDKLARRKWRLLIFDEGHHYPAPSYSRLAFLDADYRLTLTGTPWREDGHSEYIYLLGGYPYGSDWNRLVKEGWIRKPPVYLHVTAAKLWTLKRLVQRLAAPLLVFCDTVALGKEAAKALGIPYVYGVHSVKKRLEMVEKHKRLIVSRVFDEGISLPELRTVIEYDMLFGSRRQEAQRAGRLLHSVYEGTEYHIIMTPEELEKYGKRLQSLYARDFEIKLVKEGA